MSRATALKTTPATAIEPWRHVDVAALDAQNRGPTSTPADSPDDYLTVETVARIYRVNKVSLYRMIRTGELKAVRVGSRIIRIRRSDCDALAQPYAVVGGGDDDA